MPWSSSPTTIRLSDPPATTYSSSACAWLVSWNSSTSTWRAASCTAARRSGWARSRSRTRTIDRPKSSRPSSASHRSWRLEDAGELELAARPVGGRGRPGARNGRLGPAAVRLGRDQLVAARVDAAHELVDHADAVAAQVEQAQVQLAQPVQHHQRPVLGAGDRGVGQQAALGPVDAGDVERVRVEGRDPQRLVRGAQDLLGAGAQLDRRLAREGERQDLVGRRALLDQPRQAAAQDARLARARAREHDGGAAGMGDGGALLGGEIVRHGQVMVAPPPDAPGRW